MTLSTAFERQMEEGLADSRGSAPPIGQAPPVRSTHTFEPKGSETINLRVLFTTINLRVIFTAINLRVLFTTINLRVIFNTINQLG